MDIEGYAVAKVLESLAITEHLVGYISLRDKEPVWDGFVYIYTDRVNHKKENLKGRVPVQIKGQLTTKKKKFNDHIKYSIRVSDLKHYLLEGGAVFFVVQINQEQMRSQIYVAKLLPYSIKKLLPDSEENQTVSVEFSIFPKDETKKNNFFFNFLNDMVKQKSIASLNSLQSLEELQSLMSIKRVTLSFTDTALSNGNPFKYLMENSVFEYAELPNGTTIPVRELPPIEKILSTAKAPISCGGQFFYDSYSTEYTHDKRIITLGKGVRIEYNICGKSSATLNLSPQGTLQDIITDISFFSRLLKENEFLINEVPVKFSCTVKDTELIKQRDNLEKSMRSLKNLQKALVLVGFSQDILISELSETDNEKLSNLVASIISGKAIFINDGPDKSHFFVMSFSQYNIMLLAMRVDKNSFRLVNFFTKGVTVEIDNDDDPQVLKEAPGVLFLTTENFMTLNNINYNIIYDEITAFPNVDRLYHEAVNQLLLRMLLAYDRKSDTALLSCAIKIAAWLCSLSVCANKEIDYLNYLQALYRERDLTDTENLQLKEIAQSTQVNYALKTAAYIILHDDVNAKANFERLSEQEQKDFILWPIMNLWKNSDSIIEAKE